MPIVSGAGFYTQPFYPEEIATMSEDDIVQAILKQVDADPIGALGEIGSWDEISDTERKVFRAVGRAQAETNLGVFTAYRDPGQIGDGAARSPGEGGREAESNRDRTRRQSGGPEGRSA